MPGPCGSPYVGLQLIHLVLHGDAQLRGRDGQQLQLRQRSLHLDDLRTQQRTIGPALAMNFRGSRPPPTENAEETYAGY